MSDENERDIFQPEKDILQSATDISKQKEYQDNPLSIHFKDLTKNYKRLLRQTGKLMKISDSNQKHLNIVQNKLEEEITERKKIMEQLQEAKDELQETNRKLEDLSMLDGLTGIPNRRRFDQVIDTEWRRAKRKKHYLTVIMIDIDFFKQYNDTYGHLAGDECIKSIAQTINTNLHRAGDFAARYGGEEFVVLLPDTDVPGSLVVAEHIRESIQKLAIPHSSSKISDSVTVSLGLASILPEEECMIAIKDFIDNADKALYQAKQSGRNRYVSAGRISG